jgi:alanine racemase
MFPKDNPQFAIRNPQFTGRPTWAEVDLSALVHNYRQLCSLIPGSKDCRLQTADCELSLKDRQSAIRDPQSAIPRLIPVIKADAYGHGAVETARALSLAGATAFAVALVQEGISLREAGIRQEILVLEGSWPGEEAELVRHGLTGTVYSPGGIRRLAAAVQGGTPVSVHLKIDTGMARLGAPWDGLGSVLDGLRESPAIRLTGTFSHLACSEEEDPAFTLEQVRRFEAALKTIRAAGIAPGEIHLANSGGWIHHPPLRGWSARPGIALYGYPPAPERCPLDLKPVLTLKTRIGCLRTIPPGAPAGYNRRFTARQTTRAATLPVGYADGYRRDLSGKGLVLIRGCKVPVVGTVSMDMIIADVSSVPDAREGDEVTLLGADGSHNVDAAVWAGWAGTIPYEILCGLGPRIPRIYLSSSPEIYASC